MSLEQFKDIILGRKSFKPVMFCGKRPVGFESIVREIYASDNWYLQYIDCDGMDGEDFHYKLDFLDSIYIPDDGALYKSLYNSAFFFDNLRYYPRGNDRYYDAGKIIRTWTRSFFTTRPRRTNYVPGEDYRNEEIEIVDERSTAIPILRFVNRVVAYTDDFKPFPIYFQKQFEAIPLDSETDEGGQQKDTFDVSVEPKPKQQQQQEVKSVETTLSYNKTTGIFEFGGEKSVAIAENPATGKKRIAVSLMKYWKKGKPCPHNALATPLISPLPQFVVDCISAIRKALKPLNVNIPYCTNKGYLPPSEPEHFDITE
jgi:hypothetical protein